MRYVLVSAAAVVLAAVAFFAVRGMGSVSIRIERRDEPTGEAEDLAGRLAELEKDVAQRPADASIRLRRGQILLRMGNFAEARESFEKAFALEPASIEALYGAAASSEMLQDYHRALGAYLEIRKLRPDEPGLDQRIRAAESAVAGAHTHP